MRLIDADALIKWINESRCADCPDKQDERCAACQWDDVIMSIETAPTVGGWVSVKDRLPEESGKVLVYCKDGYMTDVNFSARHQQFNNFDVCAKQNEVWDVTHWMPLPEPPEEVSGDG